MKGRALLFVCLLIGLPVAAAKDPVAERVRHLIEQLKSEDSSDRRKAARELGTLGPGAKAAVPQLARALADSGWDVADQARKALEAVGKAGVPALLKAMKSKETEVRLGVSAVLLKINDHSKEHLSKLVPLLKDDSGTVRNNIADLLGGCGEPAVAPLMRSIGARDDGHRNATARALGRIGEPAQARLRAALGFRKFRVRAGAARSLGVGGPISEPAIGKLVELVGDPEPLVRLESARALSRIRRRPDASLSGILRAIGDADPAVREAGVAGAVDFGAGGLPSLLDSLGDFDAATRPGVIDALSLLGQVSMEALNEGLGSPLAGIRAGCARALGGMGLLDRVDVSALSPLLEDAEPKVRLAAVESLGARGFVARGETGGLVDLLGREKEIAVLVATATTLGEIAAARPTVDAALDRAGKSADGGLRSAAAFALWQLHGDNPAALSVLQAVAGDAKAGADARRTAVARLGLMRLAAAPAVPLLVALLGEEGDEVVTAAAIDALGSIARAHASGVTGRKGRYARLPGKVRERVEAALQWLAKHQNTRAAGIEPADGRWDADGFVAHGPEGFLTGPGGALYDAGVTGLALSALLAPGYPDRGEGSPNAANVREGLAYLVGVQDATGSFASWQSQHFLAAHAFATIAMCEAWILTGDGRYGRAAQRALDLCCQSRNRDLAWRYAPRGGENDTNMTVLMLTALRLGALGGLDVDEDAFAGGGDWIERMTDPEFGQTGYNYPGGSSARPEGLIEKFPPEKVQAMTAAGLWSRCMVGKDLVETRVFRLGIDLCREVPPLWSVSQGTIDMYYWYFGTLVFAQLKEKHRDFWRGRIERALIPNQRGEDPPACAGSWDPAGAWGPDGGRIYSTAIGAASLAAPARFARGFWDEPKPTGHFAEAVAALRGVARGGGWPAPLRRAAKVWLGRIPGAR